MLSLVRLLHLLLLAKHTARIAQQRQRQQMKAWL
jgi:hypothetical protein